MITAAAPAAAAAAAVPAFAVAGVKRKAEDDEEGAQLDENAAEDEEDEESEEEDEEEEEYEESASYAGSAAAAGAASMYVSHNPAQNLSPPSSSAAVPSSYDPSSSFVHSPYRTLPHFMDRPHFDQYRLQHSMPSSLPAVTALPAAALDAVQANSAHSHLAPPLHGLSMLSGLSPSFGAVEGADAPALDSLVPLDHLSEPLAQLFCVRSYSASSAHSQLPLPRNTVHARTPVVPAAAAAAAAAAMPYSAVEEFAATQPNSD
jgi:hypothetical protein